MGPNRRYIELAVKPSLVEFDGFINYGSPILGGPDSPGEVSANAILMPVFSKTEVNTNVTLADGATMVIGGLLKNSRLKFEDSVPILGKIPLMGRFFRSESETNTRTALLVFVKVRLVDPAGQPFRDDR